MQKHRKNWGQETEKKLYSLCGVCGRQQSLLGKWDFQLMERKELNFKLNQRSSQSRFYIPIIENANTDQLLN